MFQVNQNKYVSPRQVRDIQNENNYYNNQTDNSVISNQSSQLPTLSSKRQVIFNNNSLSQNMNNVNIPTPTQNVGYQMIQDRNLNDLYKKPSISTEKLINSHFQDYSKNINHQQDKFLDKTRNRAISNLLLDQQLRDTRQERQDILQQFNNQSNRLNRSITNTNLKNNDYYDLIKSSRNIQYQYLNSDQFQWQMDQGNQLKSKVVQKLEEQAQQKIYQYNMILQQQQNLENMQQTQEQNQFKIEKQIVLRTPKSALKAKQNIIDIQLEQKRVTAQQMISNNQQKLKINSNQTQILPVNYPNIDQSDNNILYNKLQEDFSESSEKTYSQFQKTSSKIQQTQQQPQQKIGGPPSRQDDKQDLIIQDNKINTQQQQQLKKPHLNKNEQIQQKHSSHREHSNNQQQLQDKNNSIDSNNEEKNKQYQNQVVQKKQLHLSTISEEGKVQSASGYNISKEKFNDDDKLQDKNLDEKHKPNPQKHQQQHQQQQQQQKEQKQPQQFHSIQSQPQLGNSLHLDKNHEIKNEQQQKQNQQKQNQQQEQEHQSQQNDKNQTDNHNNKNLNKENEENKSDKSLNQDEKQNEFNQKTQEQKEVIESSQKQKQEEQEQQQQVTPFTSIIKKSILKGSQPLDNSQAETTSLQQEKQKENNNNKTGKEEEEPKKQGGFFRRISKFFVADEEQMKKNVNQTLKVGLFFIENLETDFNLNYKITIETKEGIYKDKNGKEYLIQSDQILDSFYKKKLQIKEKKIFENSIDFKQIEQISKQDSQNFILKIEFIKEDLQSFGFVIHNLFTNSLFSLLGKLNVGKFDLPIIKNEDIEIFIQGKNISKPLGKLNFSLEVETIKQE